MSTTFAEYCEEFFESVVGPAIQNVRDDITVRYALVAHYKFVDILKDLGADACKFRQFLPIIDALERTMEKHCCTFRLPNPAYRTRYSEVTDDIFELFIRDRFFLKVMPETARRLFDDVLICDRQFSNSLARIVAGFNIMSDFDTVSSTVSRMCSETDQDQPSVSFAFVAFSSRIPEFAYFFDIH